MKTLTRETKIESEIKWTHKAERNFSFARKDFSFMSLRLTSSVSLSLPSMSSSRCGVRCERNLWKQHPTERQAKSDTEGKEKFCQFFLHRASNSVFCKISKRLDAKKRRTGRKRFQPYEVLERKKCFNFMVFNLFLNCCLRKRSEEMKI